MSQLDDLQAIDRNMRSHQNDPGAAAPYAAWRKWYDDLNPEGLLTWLSDSDVQKAEQMRDTLFAAIRQPNLTAQGWVPADKAPPIDVSKEFAGGGAPPTIKKGSRGAPVRWVQKYLHITEDGNFGSGTDAAVKAWQKEQGLTQDGIIGPLSWARMGVHTVSDIQAPPAGIPGFTAPAVVPPALLGQSAPPVTTTSAGRPPTLPKPAPTAVAPKPATPTLVSEAGVLGTLGKLPTPVKIGGGVAIAAVLFAGLGKKKHHR